MAELLVCIFLAICFVAVVYVPAWLYTRWKYRKDSGSEPTMPASDGLLSRDVMHGTMIRYGEPDAEGNIIMKGALSPEDERRLQNYEIAAPRDLVNTTLSHSISYKPVSRRPGSADRVTKPVVQPNDDRRRDDTPITYETPASTWDWQSADAGSSLSDSSSSSTSDSSGPPVRSDSGSSSSDSGSSSDSSGGGGDFGGGGGGSDY